jgi:hypothetical protein
MKAGGHGEGFRYLPMQKGGRRDHFPRIIQIAGVYPDLTPEELYAPTSAPAAKVGSWTYDFSDPEGPQLGTVAVPGSEVVTRSIDPVAIISKSTDLGIGLAEEVEMLVVIDRGDRDWNPEKFFIVRTPENRLRIQWFDMLEPGYDILGKVVVSFVPFIASMAPAETGFAEADEDED